MRCVQCPCRSWRCGSPASLHKFSHRRVSVCIIAKGGKNSLDCPGNFVQLTGLGVGNLCKKNYGRGFRMVEKPLEKVEDIVWLRNCADNPEKRADIVPCMCSHRVSTVEEERLHAVDAKFEEYLVAFAEAEVKLRASFSLALKRRRE